MMKQRVEYIDALRGLCIMWVVWYHSVHPDWVGYPFRLPVLFFVSGIFFKEYSWTVFWRKKVNMYIIPFIFFYLLYYVFLLAININDISSVSGHIFDVFRLYEGNGGFVCNYPLWFICALLNIQLFVYFFKRISQSDIALLVTSIIITIIGCAWFWKQYTPLFLGKSTTFLLYYVCGHLFGKKYISYIQDKRKLLWICPVLLIVIAVAYILSGCNLNSILTILSDQIHFLSIALLLIVVFRLINDKSVSKVFKFFGKNSLIIFGLHDMYLSILTIVYCKLVGTPNNYIGVAFVIVTLIMIWPSVFFLHRWFPKFVGKDQFFKV